MSRLPASLVALAILVLAGDGSSASADDDESSPSLSGRLVWVSAGDLDLVGDVRAEFPWRVHDSGDALLALRAVTTIERAPSDLTFDVRDLDYAIETGWRSAGARRRWSVRAGQIGRERVDADGQPWLRWIGGGVESASFSTLPDASGGVAWRVQAGVVVDEREVAADGVLRAALRLAPGSGGGPWSWGVDVDVDALLAAGRLRPDVEIGPRLSLPFGSGRRASVLAHWFRGRHPLGPRIDGVLVGIEVAEGRGASGGVAAPDLWGEVALGGGSGRESGRFRLALESPPLVGAWRAGFEVDANVLTAGDTGDLFYRYHAGAQRPAGRRGRVGAWFHHRSNHALAEPNDTVTSVNVLETGIETRGYDGAPADRCAPRSSGACVPTLPGCLDARVRLGWLVDSSFGEDRRWHVRAGARWRLAPAWLGVEAEAGDVERYAARAGVAIAKGWDLALERRRDEQSFAADRRAWLLSGRYGF